MPNLLLLLVQIGVVVIAARMVGLLFRRIHQPQVMGEMVAGILLGPSLLGWAAPAASAWLFPPASLGFLNSLSQIGLLVFMFLVGLELNPRLLREKRHAAVVISHASIVVPFMLGAALSLFLYPRLSDDSVSFTGFALFMGAAMSVTAFPVLARILTERDLLRTRVGAVTIACAAVDDVTAWCILAGVVALVRASDAGGLPLWVTLGGSVAFVLLMLYPVRRLLAGLEERFRRRGDTVTQDMLAVILLVALASAWATEWLGIHALFGAFLAGAVMPKSDLFVHALTEKLEDVIVVLLLPLFFAFTGLRTSIGLVEGAEMWLFCGLIILVAIVGKWGGSSVAARMTGMPWREAGALGVLMNTRGLMELVILNIGLDIGVISPALFTMMVLMALVTTFMTSPLLELIYPPRLIRDADDSAARAAPEPARAAV
jgi:Kef-type K+ transport system membrane component KefB